MICLNFKHHLNTQLQNVRSLLKSRSILLAKWCCYYSIIPAQKGTDASGLSSMLVMNDCSLQAMNSHMLPMLNERDGVGLHWCQEGTLAACYRIDWSSARPRKSEWSSNMSTIVHSLECQVYVTGSLWRTEAWRCRQGRAYWPHPGCLRLQQLHMLDLRNSMLATCCSRRLHSCSFHCGFNLLQQGQQLTAGCLATSSWYDLSSDSCVYKHDEQVYACISVSQHVGQKSFKCNMTVVSVSCWHCRQEGKGHEHSKWSEQFILQQSWARRHQLCM